MKEQLKFLAKGVLGMFLCFFIGKLCMAFSWMIVSCFATVIMGVVWPVVFYNKNQSSTALISGIFAIIFSGIVPAILTDYSGLGFSAENVPLRNVTEYSQTSIFTFNNARVQDTIHGYEPIMGRRSKVADVYVFPITDENWNYRDTIHAWAITDSRHFFEKNELTVRGALQSVDKDEAYEAIKDAVDGWGLKSHPDALVLHWSRNPKAEFKNEWMTSFMFPVAFSIIWGFIFLITYKPDK